MANSARIDELEKKFSENARRYFAPLANEYRKAGDLDRAIEICRAHLPQQPGHMSGHVVYGQALYESRQLEEAKSVFEAALALDPENLIALRHLGDIARDGGDPGTARTWYMRVLDADPRNDEVAGMLAELDAAGPAPEADAAPPPDASSVGWGDINPERPAAEGAAAPSESAAPSRQVDRQAAESADKDEAAEDASAPAGDEGSESTAGTDAAGAASRADKARATEPDASAEAALFAADAAPPAASLDRMLNEAFAAEADTLEIEPYAPEKAPAAAGSAPSGSKEPQQLDDEAFAEVDALFDEIAPPRQTGSQRAVTGAQTAQPDSGTAASAASPTRDTGDTMFGDDATPDSAGGAAAVPGLETAEFVSPSRAPAGGSGRRDTGSMAVTGLTSFDQPTDEDSSTRAAFVTETMAELYLQQGFVAEALDIYRQLLAQNPDDASLRDRVEQLEAGNRTSLSMAAVSSEVIEAAKQRHSTRKVRTVRSFFGLLAGRRAPHHGDRAEQENGDEYQPRSEPVAPEPYDTRATPDDVAPIRLDLVGGLFDDAPVSEEDEQAASTLAAGFASAMFAPADARGAAKPEPAQSQPSQSGRAARPGAGELSLDQVFREPAPRNPGKSGSYSFDQFFSDGTPGAAGSESTDASAEESGEAPEGDLEQFTAWLEGLKRK